jgi:hypothetical protein
MARKDAKYATLRVTIESLRSELDRSVERTNSDRL